MKTPEEIIESYLGIKISDDKLDSYNELNGFAKKVFGIPVEVDEFKIDLDNVKKLIKIAQTEAWNEAVEACAENAKTYYWGTSEFGGCDVEKQSILKLLKK